MIEFKEFDDSEKVMICFS